MVAIDRERLISEKQNNKASPEGARLPKEAMLLRDIYKFTKPSLDAFRPFGLISRACQGPRGPLYMNCCRQAPAFDVGKMYCFNRLRQLCQINTVVAGTAAKDCYELIVCGTVKFPSKPVFQQDSSLTYLCRDIAKPNNYIVHSKLELLYVRIFPDMSGI